MHPEGKNTDFLACKQPSCCRLNLVCCDLHDVLRWNFRSYVRNKLHFISIISCLIAYCGCLLNVFASFVTFWTDLYFVTCKMINWFRSILIIMMGPGFEIKHRECGYCKHLALLLGVPNSWADFIGLWIISLRSQYRRVIILSVSGLTGMIDCAEQLNEMFR